MQARRAKFRVALAGLVGMTAASEVGPAHGDPCDGAGRPARRADTVQLAELRRRAVEHAGLAPTSGLRRRARLAGLVPDVSVRGGRGVAWDDPWTGVRASDDEIARRETYDLRLTWRLDRLVFDHVEPSVVAGERSAARARLELEDEVTARYFRWRRAELDLRAARAGDRGRDGDGDGDDRGDGDGDDGDDGSGARAGDGARLQLAADEAFASLDGLTGGWLTARQGCRR